MSLARLNIYLDDPALRTLVKVAAARQGTSVSAYCLAAIRQRLAEDALAPPPATYEAARTLDELRRTVGRVGTPVAELIAEGRR